MSQNISSSEFAIKEGAVQELPGVPQRREPPFGSTLSFENMSLFKSDLVRVLVWSLDEQTPPFISRQHGPP